MASLTVKGTAIRGIASSVPVNRLTTADFAKVFGADEAEKIAMGSGVRTLRAGGPKLCSSDLCYAASESLLKGLAWDRGSIEALVFVSQSFDYPMPATACILQARLGLPKTCAAFDVSLACSGYVYGLWIATGLIATGCKRVLLLAGEMGTRMVSPTDRTTAPLLGDAGSATALESDDGAVMHFELGTDGAGYQHLMVPAGTATARLPHSAQTMTRTERAPGIIRSDDDLQMNGKEIFTFALREAPPLIESILQRSQWQRDEVDYFLFHQANKFMLVHLGNRIGIPEQKLPLILEHYGNTSSASIPLTVTHAIRQTLEKRKLKLVLAGFGAGLSWGACAVEMGPIVAPPLIEVP
ncbi:MAG: ketoacyl-ACP synthase III [Lentisphaerota bacterium]